MQITSATRATELAISRRAIFMRLWGHAELHLLITSRPRVGGEPWAWRERDVIRRTSWGRLGALEWCAAWGLRVGQQDCHGGHSAGL
jgi:hypothetical protein